MHLVHSDVRLLVHVVWSTTNRAALLAPQDDAHLHSLLIAAIPVGRAHLTSFGASDDHVHVLVELAATARLCDVVQALKGASARRWNDQPPRGAPLLRWQEDYWARSVTPGDVAALERYVREQRAHHATPSAAEPWDGPSDLAPMKVRLRTFRDESIALSAAAGFSPTAQPPPASPPPRLTPAPDW